MLYTFPRKRLCLLGSFMGDVRLLGKSKIPTQICSDAMFETTELEHSMQCFQMEGRNGASQQDKPLQGWDKY